MDSTYSELSYAELNRLIGECIKERGESELALEKEKSLPARKVLEARSDAASRELVRLNAELQRRHGGTHPRDQQPD